MPKKLLLLGLSALFTILLLLSLEGAASLWTKWQATSALPPVREVSHCEYDPLLGWLHEADKRVPDLYGYGVGISTNGQRLRGTRDYPLDDSDDRYRILCLGDSFTMGYGVGDEDTYPAQMTQQDPRVETINMGLGGYGIDQCYLWYRRDGTKFDVDVLLFAIIVGDFFRINPDGNVTEAFKPIMKLVDGEPVAINTPVENVLTDPDFGTRLGKLWRTTALMSLLPRTLAAPALKATSVAEQPFAPIALRIFEILRDVSRERDQLFVVALLPVHEELALERMEIIDDWLQPALAERGIPFVDLRPVFKQEPKAALAEYFTMSHYSRRGNRLAAKALLDGIRALDPKCPR
jgi:hypothetical protein